RDLVARVESAHLGMVRTEVPVVVSYRDFSKTYYLDLVIGDCAIYELKAVAELSPEHEAQLLNYLFLLEMGRGKLVNFRPAQVQTRFMNTTLTLESRRQMTVNPNRWIESDAASRHLRLTFLELLADWGGFLELPLYYSALTHFFGGEEKVLN